MAVHTDALSQVYAKSLYELAEQAGGRDKIEEVGDELEQICELARQDPMFREFLASPIIDERKRGEALRAIFSDKVTDLTLRFLLVLGDKGRLGHLESINAGYDQLMQKAFGRIEVDVFTVEALGDEALSMLKDRIRDALGKDPVLHAYAAPDMIGGVKLRIGDQLIDGSVATRLRRLRSQLTGPGAVKVRSEASRFVDEAG